MLGCLSLWTPPKRSPKMVLGQGHTAHGRAICVLEISDVWPDIGRRILLDSASRKTPHIRKKLSPSCLSQTLLIIGRLLTSWELPKLGICEVPQSRLRGKGQLCFLASSSVPHNDTDSEYQINHVFHKHLLLISLDTELMNDSFVF